MKTQTPKYVLSLDDSIWLNPQTEELESYQIPTFLCAGHMRQAENPDAFVVNNLTRFVFIPAYNCPLCIPVITPLCEERNVKTFQLNPGEIVAKQKG